MIPGGGGNPYYLQNHHHQHLFHALDGMDGGGAFMGAAEPAVSESDTNCHALLYNLSVLKDKVQQLQPLVGLAVAHDGPGPVAAASGASAVIQEIISAGSSMMYAFQQLCSHGTSSANAAAQVQEDHSIAVDHHGAAGHAKNGIAATTDSGCDDQAAVVMYHVMNQWQRHHDGYDNTVHCKTTVAAAASSSQATWMAEEEAGTIIELEVAELLAKYTHYCQVCGKGFKRDANLRMHMRAHGDEYKSSAALANPAKSAGGDAAAAAGVRSSGGNRSYYSCPQEGCRWNRKHAKFQPLKSVICAKNHYKRSHCPKIYVCNRCNRKHFSVLSDLRTHEKHCGDHRWLCSCGTSFSRKDKLIGHLTLFAGHQPAVPLDRHANGKRSSSSTSAQLGT